ncbi:hypothetical protein ACFMQL_39200 [Nonomuraea fastidiosa]|uniref:hypothetical protein n=1 Tax=Nonomuraea fastidiosa TaxID=46173 RepID=UPI00366C7DC7
MRMMLYFEDPYRTEADTSVVRSGTDDRGPYVVLAEPLFYPQGGGQKGDRGRLRLAGGLVLDVVGTRKAEDEIRHYLAAGQEPPAPGPARQELDWPFRYHQMRLHSAAHFLHVALEREIGASLPYPVRAPLSETGGECHYAFAGRFGPDQLERAVKAANAHTAQGHPIVTRTDEERGPGMRSWHCAGDTVACGGLHPRDSSEVGDITASMRIKRGKTLVSFALAHP